MQLAPLVLQGLKARLVQRGLPDLKESKEYKELPETLARQGLWGLSEYRGFRGVKEIQAPLVLLVHKEPRGQLDQPDLLA